MYSRDIPEPLQAVFPGLGIGCACPVFARFAVAAQIAIFCQAGAEPFSEVYFDSFLCLSFDVFVRAVKAYEIAPVAVWVF